MTPDPAGSDSRITLDRQVVSRRCEQCGVEFVVVRGSVFERGRPIGLYLIGLHGHTAAGRLAHLALALLDESGMPIAVALDMTATPEDFGYSAVDWSDSPWKGETYLGLMLDRADALASPMKPKVFTVAGRIARDLPEVQHYFQ